MTISAKSRADSALAATRTTKNLILDEIQEARRERAEQVAKLRGLRLAKEAADKEADANAASGKTAPGNEWPMNLPQAHRRQC
jgi:ClpP class serine protease